MSLPVVELRGSPYEQGLAHGRALRERIAHNLKVYYQRFAREAGLEREELLRRTRRYLTALRHQSEDYVQGMRGISDASGIPQDEIAFLNLRYELLYFQVGQRMQEASEGVPPEGDGCTSFALLPEKTREGHLVMGQNWDWIPQAAGALLAFTEPDGLRGLAFSEAGIFGAKIGLNSAGVGLAINGMLTTDDDWSRLARPFHLRCHEVLRARDFDAALSLLADEPRSCTTNFLVAQAPDRVADLEAAPERICRLTCEAGFLAHANHFRDPEGLGVVEPPNPRRHLSRHREARLSALLSAGGPLSIVEIQERLRDHVGRPNSVCRHEDGEIPVEQRVRTLTSIIMDLDAGRLWASDGPPCEGEYQALSL